MTYLLFRIEHISSKARVKEGEHQSDSLFLILFPYTWAVLCLLSIGEWVGGKEASYPLKLKRENG
jgi:hypothetical protein